MGRRKLEMKRIEDKSSRQITFSKRRSGLFKKARYLSLLCDADIAVIVFSARDKLYEFSSGGTGASNTSVEHILSRYEKNCLEAAERTVKGSASQDLEFLLQCTRFQTCKELLHRVDRLVEENNTEELSVNDMTQLEQELDAALMQTRLRKTQLMMEHISTLPEEQKKLSEEKKEMEKQQRKLREETEKQQVVASAKHQQQLNESDGGGGLNDLATNQINLPQLVTLALFNG